MDKTMGLDGVELVMAWEETFGISIDDEDAGAMYTPRHAVDYIFEKVRSESPEDSGCLATRAYFRLRKSFQAEGVPRNEVRPDAKVASLLPSRNRRDILNSIRQRAGFLPLRRLPFGLQFTSGCVRDIVLEAVVDQHAALRLPGHGWSRAQVREVVRAVMFFQLALRRFSDDAHFVKDLNID